jgi:hypothetical protein
MYTIAMGPLYNAQSSPGVPDGIWNTPLANNTPIDPESANLVAVMDKWFPGPNSNRANFSATNQVRIWIAGPATRLVKVTLDPGSAYQQDLQEAFNQVPFPAGAQPSPGTDERMAILQPNTGCLWEFWHLYWNTTDNSWHAGWGGRTCHVWTDYGAFRNVEDSAGNVLEQDGWGGSAASLADYAGAMRVDELAHGAIPHAIAFAIDVSANCSGLWSLPAERTDGATAPILDLSGRPTNCIPEGARFRLPPPCDPPATPASSTPGVCFNLSDLAGDPPIIQEMAAAVQQYGMIDMNSTSGGLIGVESGAPGDPPYIALGGDPYTTAINGESNTPFFGSCTTCTNQNDLAEFPWNYLELVQMNVTSTPDETWYTQVDPPSPLWPSSFGRPR